MNRDSSSTTSAILDVKPLGFPWVTIDPFLFCVHHDDAYPEGNDAMGPTGSLSGRDLGQDFTVKDGFRMYHGKTVPGFPQHPHRGFETVTIVRRGFIDHSDSLGATARFGRGDTQWLTAGAGIVHSEMFPLREKKEKNPLELFQIWLNLPREDKMAPPHFAMLWNEDVPKKVFVDSAGKKAEVTIVAGALDDEKAPPPPPKSWAARHDTDVAIFCIHLEAGATWTLPRARTGEAIRTLYFYRGGSAKIAGTEFKEHRAAVVASDVDITLEAGETAVELLLLQGRPIDEPVAQYGPFVMNERHEIQRAFADYQKTQFGGWPFKNDDPVHPREEGRFARHADGRIERR